MSVKLESKEGTLVTRPVDEVVGPNSASSYPSPSSCCSHHHDHSGGGSGSSAIMASSSSGAPLSPPDEAKVGGLLLPRRPSSSGGGSNRRCGSFSDGLGGLGETGGGGGMMNPMDVVDCHCAEPVTTLGLEHAGPSPCSPSRIPPGGSVTTKPKRIIIVRHGESLGNVDEQVYVTTPDWKVPLSPRGHEQARETGRKLKDIIGSEPVYIYTSPYVRTKQTLAGILESLEDNEKVGIREEPRITEQQFGNLQDGARMKQSKRDRAVFGRFFYRFPEGESGLDVYTRVTSFISTMFRDFGDAHICRPDLNVIIVTHGLTLRLLLMRWFKFTVDIFEATTNPSNGSFVLMARKDNLQDRPGGGYELTRESSQLISLTCAANIPLSRRKSSSSLLLGPGLLQGEEGEAEATTSDKQQHLHH